MTREEAIKELEMAFTRLNINGHMDNNRKTAFDMAIKALKQPEIIYCKDCKNFMEYSDKYRQAEKAYGDCFNLKINTDNPRLIKKKFYDYCSCAERKDD